MDRKKECVKLRLESYVVEFLSLDALTLGDTVTENKQGAAYSALDNPFFGG